VIFYEKPPHVQTSEWKGEVLHIDNEELELKVVITYRRRRGGKRRKEEKVELE
jgi:hypothetical protein